MRTGRQLLNNTDKQKDTASVSPERPFKVGFSRIQAKLLSIVVPIFLTIGILSVIATETATYLENKRQLQDKLGQVAKTFEAVVAGPLWSVHAEHVTSILEAITIDKDVVGAIVFDEHGQPFAATGVKIEGAQSSLSIRRPILLTPSPGSDAKVIGTLFIAFTDEHLLAATYHRAIVETLLTIILVCIFVVTNMMVYKRLIGIPLDRVLAVIQSVSRTTRGQRVNWSSDDEIGIVAAAFNRLLEAQENDQIELEDRVEDRTRHLKLEIKEREYAEVRLSESKAQLLNILNNSPYGVSILARNSRERLYVNQRLVEMFGATEKDIIDSYMTKSQRADIWAKFERDGFLDSVSVQRKRPDGTVWWCLSDWRHISFGETEAVMIWHMDITARKNAEEELFRSEEQFRGVFESSAAGMTLVNMDGNFIRVNQQFCDIVGYSQEELLSMNWRELTHNDDVTATEALDKRVETGELNEYFTERRTVRKDGIEIWTSVAAAQLPEHENVERYFYSFIHDISELKDAQQQLENERNLINLTIESIDQGVIVRDDKDKIVLFNSLLPKLLGVPSEFYDSNASSAELTEFHQTQDEDRKRTPEDRKKINEWIDKRQRGEQAEDFSYQREGENGINILANFKTMSNGYEIRTFQDISELKRAENEIRRHSDFVDLLRMTATDANNSTNFKDAMQVCLDRICAFTKWPVGHIYMKSENEDDVLISSGIWHLDNPEQFAVFRKITEETEMVPGQAFVTQVFTTGKPLWIEDVSSHPTYSRARATDQDIQVRAGFALPIMNQEKVVAVLEFYTVDIIEQDDDLMQSLVQIGAQLGRVFERMLAEKSLRAAMDDIDNANRNLERKVDERTLELIEAMDKAETANLSKTEFLANMSHELRTPLNAIIGFSEIIEMAMFGPLEGQYQEYAKDINSSGEHLLGIISDILDISKVETGELDIDEELINVEETAAACEVMVRSRAVDSGVTLTIELSTGLPLLNADPLRVKQILLNLIGNAIKFTPEGGLISVTGKVANSGGVALMVEDTGIGIDEEDIPTALEKFGQIRDGHTHAHEGAGIGLALSNLLMERHGGRLEIASEVGKGTIVTVIFPPERSTDIPERHADNN